MFVTAEFITATAFAVVMVLIGLGAIWIVRWQTYFLLRHQGGHDLERGSRSFEPIVAGSESVGLVAASHPSPHNSNPRESGPAVDDNVQHVSSTERLSCLSGNTLVDKAWQEIVETSGSKGTSLEVGIADSSD